MEDVHDYTGILGGHNQLRLLASVLFWKHWKNPRAIMYIFFLQLFNVFCQYLSIWERRKMYLTALIWPKHHRQSACLLVCTYRYIMWKTCLKNKSESKGQKKLKKDLKRRNQLRAKYQVHVIYCQSCRYVINLKPNKINNRDTFRWLLTLDVINAWKHRIV